MEGQTNINSCRVSELNKQNINALVKTKLHVNLLQKYIILFKDILTF